MCFEKADALINQPQSKLEVGLDTIKKLVPDDSVSAANLPKSGTFPGRH